MYKEYNKDIVVGNTTIGNQVMLCKIISPEKNLLIFAAYIHTATIEQKYEF